MTYFFYFTFYLFGGAYASNASHLAPAYGPAMDGATCQLKRDAKILGVGVATINITVVSRPGI